ncbi:hypothetical protein N7493_009662 [Penicillium malachiteum]|uniref:Amidase domain-containing protein n=1 Tax=Penicillium malachiteum TaxID=1324776 RepID=A0AAD6HER5_9EURO|nr:hypothetical protein N7493_009662 [Penicillium malachiteum]
MIIRSSETSTEKDMDLLTLDAKALQALLTDGQVMSYDLVKRYLAQIVQHDDKLRAMIKTTPIELLEATAISLDEERASGKIRGPLHGIPILIKDNIATHPSLGLPTTVGSLALLSSKPSKNAHIIDQIIDAGLIIMGKTNLPEFANARGSKMPNGWSAVRGQTESAYVRGRAEDGNTPEGHWNPSGSSTGSAVGVSAGYAPIAIGTETDGSLVSPSNRAALYTIKPTIGLVSGEGIIPISSTFDSAGPMTKSTYDLAVLLDVLVTEPASESFTTSLTGSWSDISVAALDPAVWKLEMDNDNPADGARDQINREIREAYKAIEEKAKKFVNNIDLISPDEFKIDGESCEWTIVQADMKPQLNAYLEGLEESDVRSLAEIIAFNEKHADLELPPHHPRQDTLIKSQNNTTSAEEYERNLSFLRQMGREKGVDLALKTHGVDVIIGPADSELSSMASATGYPICAMPLSYLDLNGRPFGMAAIAGKHQEHLLIKVMSAWEATFPARQPPPQLVNPVCSL